MIIRRAILRIEIRASSISTLILCAMLYMNLKFLDAQLPIGFGLVIQPFAIYIHGNQRVLLSDRVSE